MRSDHRQLWVEVDNSTILGKHLPASFPTPCSKLRSDNPRSRNRYTKLAHQEHSKLGVVNTANSIQELLLQYQNGDLSVKQTLIDSYEGLHQDTSEARLEIESKLQSRYVRGVPWSPKLQSYQDEIELWKKIVQLRQGAATSQTELRRLSQKLRIYSVFYADLPSAVLQLDLAYRSYRDAELLAPD